MKKIIFTIFLSILTLSSFSQSTVSKHILNKTKRVWCTDSTLLDTCYWLKIPNSELYLVKVKTSENSSRRIVLFIFRDRKGMPYEWVKNKFDLTDDEMTLPLFKSEDALKVKDILDMYNY